LSEIQWIISLSSLELSSRIAHIPVIKEMLNKTVVGKNVIRATVMTLQYVKLPNLFCDGFGG
jgi:hypothetical protein